MPVRIVIFAKAPVPGEVKTRLIPALGPEGAAKLAQQMLEDTCREALASGVGPVELCVSGCSASLPAGVEVTEQGQGDLGERLARAGERMAGPFMFIGTDCPGLDGGRIAAAAWEMETHDAVIHPTSDGGYALLALKRFDPSIFSGIAWSTSSVANSTVGKIGALGWSVHIGDTLQDVDEPEDLALVMPDLMRGDGSGLYR